MKNSIAIGLLFFQFVFATRGLAAEIGCRIGNTVYYKNIGTFLNLNIYSNAHSHTVNTDVARTRQCDQIDDVLGRRNITDEGSVCYINDRGNVIFGNPQVGTGVASYQRNPCIPIPLDGYMPLALLLGCLLGCLVLLKMKESSSSSNLLC